MILYCIKFVTVQSFFASIESIAFVIFIFFLFKNENKPSRFYMTEMDKSMQFFRTVIRWKKRKIIPHAIDNGLNFSSFIFFFDKYYSNIRTRIVFIIYFILFFF